MKSIDADKEEDRILKEKEDNIKSKLDNLSKELVLGKEANKKLETLEKYKIDFERLNALKESFKLKEEELRYAKKAVTALNYEEKYIEKKRILDRIRKNLSISIENLNKLKIHLEKAEVDFKKEVEKEPIRNELNKRIDEIQGLKEKTLVYKENSEKLNLLKASYTKIKERIENIKKEIDEKTKLLIEINNEINIIQSLKEEASKLDIESLNYKAKEEKLNTLKLSIDKLINELSKEKKLREDYEVLNNNYINKRKMCIRDSTAPIHGILEGLIVTPFGFSVYQFVVVVAIGTILHHFVDGAISYALANALAKARRKDLYEVFTSEVV